MRPCEKQHLSLLPEKCDLCWLAVYDERYQSLWGLPVLKPIIVISRPALKAVQVVRKEIIDCRELGRPLRLEELPAIGVDPLSCGCANKIRLCSIHGHCTTLTPRDGFACCDGCLDKATG